MATAERLAQRFGPGLRNGFRSSVGVVERLGVWCSAAMAVLVLHSQQSNQGFPGVQNYTTLAAKARDFFSCVPGCRAPLSGTKYCWRRPLLLEPLDLFCDSLGATGECRLPAIQEFKASPALHLSLRWPRRLSIFFLVYLAPERLSQRPSIFWRGPPATGSTASTPLKT